MLNMFEAANSRVQHVNAGDTNTQAKLQSPILLRLVDLGDLVVWPLHRDAVMKLLNAELTKNGPFAISALQLLLMPQRYRRAAVFFSIVHLSLYATIHCVAGRVAGGPTMKTQKAFCHDSSQMQQQSVL